MVPSGSLHLQAAQDRCELHSDLEAEAELDRTTAKIRGCSSMLEARWQGQR
jgi:hypothetical protein